MATNYINKSKVGTDVSFAVFHGMNKLLETPDLRIALALYEKTCELSSVTHEEVEVCGTAGDWNEYEVMLSYQG